MSFYIYDIGFFVLFTLFVIIFLYKRRKKLQREGILFLYKTQVGIKVINYIGQKYKKLLNVLKYLAMVIGYGLMIGMVALLGQLIYLFVKFPSIVKALKIPPIMPLIPYLPSIFKLDFLPPFYFTYWIIIIALVALFHEFAHGIFAKHNNLKIKSTGFAFLGPFLGAFVEPDEVKMKRIKKSDQIAILSAGSFANVVLAVVFFLLFWLFFASAFLPSGVMFNTYSFSVIETSQITDITEEKINLELNGGLDLTKIKAGGESYFIDIKDIEEEQIIAFEDAPAINSGLNGIVIKINNVEIGDNEKLREELFKNKPGDEIKITTLFDGDEKEFNLILDKHPEDKSKPFIGIGMIGAESGSLFGKIRQIITFFKDPNVYYAPKINPDLTVFIYNLLWWVMLINISVALINMLPVGIFDGGRVFYLTLLAITRSEKVSSRIFKVVTYLILMIFFLLMVLWAFAFM